MGIETLVVRRISEDGPDINELHNSSGAELIACHVYTAQEVAMMHTPNGFTASWLPTRRRTVATFGADVDGRAVGCVQLIQRLTDLFGVLEFLYVEKDSRKHKVATRLIDEAVGVAQQEGYPILEVNTILREPKAVGFREKYFRPMPPNTFGYLTVLGKPFVAIGWRVPPNRLGVQVPFPAPAL